MSLCDECKKLRCDDCGQRIDESVISSGIAYTNNERTKQARKLFDLGFNENKTWEQYLVSIPAIPQSLLDEEDNRKFPLLTLVDPRLGHVKSAKLAGLKYEEWGYGENTLIPADKHHKLPGTPYWIRANDGTPNLNRKPEDCLKECKDNLYAGTADVGIALWIQHGLFKHAMDLPGSVHAGARDHCACVDPFGDKPVLYAGRFAGVADPRCGTVVFVRE